MVRLLAIVRSKLFIIALCLVLFYTLAGFFLAPYLVRRNVPGLASKHLGAVATVGKVRFNPYTCTFEAGDVRLKAPDGAPMAGVKRLFVNFEALSLFKRAWTFSEVGIEAPEVNILMDPSGRFTLGGVPLTGNQQAAPEKAHPAEAETPSEPVPLLFESIHLEQGRVGVKDLRVSTPASVSLEGLAVGLENLSTLKDGTATGTLTGRTGQKEAFSWNGRISLAPFASEGALTVSALKMETIWAFLRDTLDLEAPAGLLTLSGRYAVDTGKTPAHWQVSDAALLLEALTLGMAGDKTPFLELPRFSIKGAAVDGAGRRFDAAAVAFEGGRLGLSIQEGGGFNLARIVKPSKKAPASTGSAPSPEGKGEKTPWMLRFPDVRLKGTALDYGDDSVSPALYGRIAGVDIALAAELQVGGEKTQVAVSGGRIDLSDTRLGWKAAPEPAISVQKAALSGGAYRLDENRLTAEALSFDGGRVILTRRPDGVFNLAGPWASGKKEPGPEENAGTTTPADVEKKEDTGPSFSYLADAMALSDFEVVFSDLGVKPEGPLVAASQVAISFNNVDGKSPMTFDAGLEVKTGGRFSAKGTFDPAKGAVAAGLEVEALSLSPFQPYLEPSVTLKLASGAFSTRGEFRLNPEGESPGLGYEGGVNVTDLKLFEPGNAEPLLGWKRLQTDRLSLHLRPNRLEVGDVALRQLVSRFIIHPDKSLNVSRVVKKQSGSKTEAGPSPKPEEKADAFPVRVRRVVLTDAQVDFADLSLTPQFGTRIHELSGVVAGIATTVSSRAQVELEGRVDDYGTARVNGELNVSDPKGFTHIDLAFRNVEMMSLTPYSGRFAGRRIDSGKLSVDLNYHIEESALSGNNKIVMEKLRLGEKVKSPEAVNLPLDLAVAILEDASGVIDIGLPVKGNLDAPQFSFGGLIWKALTNLLTKIVTSPFRALGALIPGGGDMNFEAVSFDPGRFRLPPPEAEKLLKLAELLKKRPRLKLEVAGRYHPEKDLEVLQSEDLRRALAQRKGEPLKPDEAPGPVDFGSPETAGALEAMFEEVFGREELDALQRELAADEAKARPGKEEAPPRKPAPEDPGRLSKALFERLAAARNVGEERLSLLAGQRADAVAAELTGPGGVVPARIELGPTGKAEGETPPSAALQLEVGAER